MTVVVGLVVTLLLVWAKVLVEDLRIGRRIEILTYEFLQWHLSPFSSGERLPVLVVDISKIPGGKDQPTPRDTLKELIGAIIGQKPSVIGIDIDFSPNATGWITDDDSGLFDFCLKVSQEEGVPIFLGVYRTRGESSDTWLGLAKYKELAAAIVARHDDPTRVPRWIQGKEVHERLPTMSFALAKAYSLPRPPRLLTWAIEMTSEQEHGVERHSEQGFKSVETLVNYSKLEQMQHETISTISSTSVMEFGERFRGKMIVLGDATQFTDPFSAPGRNSPIGGVYVQGAGAYTFATEPLYEFKHRVRLILDFTISGLIILGVAWMRFLHVTKGESFPFRKWQARFVYGTVIAVIVAGIMLVRWLSIMWLDFFLVIFALLLHPSVERRFRRLRTRSRAMGVW